MSKLNTCAMVNRFSYFKDFKQLPQYVRATPPTSAYIIPFNSKFMVSELNNYKAPVERPHPKNTP